MDLKPKTKPNKEQRTIVFVTFESEFAPLGGIAAVMRELPRWMARAEKGRCVTITPFFREIARCKPSLFDEIHPTDHEFTIGFGKDPNKIQHKVQVFQHIDKNGFKTFFLDSAAFFNAPCDCGNPPGLQTPCNPYFDPSNPDQLVQDSLFFCVAVPTALEKLNLTENLILSLQDWEASCVALTIREKPEILSAACVLTLHNSYDRGLTDDDLRKFSEHHMNHPTDLTEMIPLMDGPICTVSENFAAELVSDPLQTDVYAQQLQDAFHRKKIVGINNGLFAEPDKDYRKAIDAARKGDFQQIIEKKKERRLELVKVLEEYQPPGAWGTLNLSDFEGPIFLMFGRDDPRQKGYDLAAAAIKNIPTGKAKYIFTPIPGNDGLNSLRFLEALATERAGEVRVFPFRMTKGYIELQRGSSFIVLPSLYEPFGGATEGYAVGTPVVARATGGLVQQVAPYPSGCLSLAAQKLSDRFHSRSAEPSGFLFREPELPREDVVAGWQAIVNGQTADRGKTVLFQAMIQEATWAFLDAIDLYANEQIKYAKMVYNGFEMLNLFSWDRAVREYQRIYDGVCY